jgi:hypothetical protein
MHHRQSAESANQTENPMEETSTLTNVLLSTTLAAPTSALPRSSSATVNPTAQSLADRLEEVGKNSKWFTVASTNTNITIVMLLL